MQSRRPWRRRASSSEPRAALLRTALRPPAASTSATSSGTELPTRDTGADLRGTAAARRASPGQLGEPIAAGFWEVALDDVCRERDPDRAVQPVLVVARILDVAEHVPDGDGDPELVPRDAGDGVDERFAEADGSAGDVPETPARPERPQREHHTRLRRRDHDLDGQPRHPGVDRLELGLGEWAVGERAAGGHGSEDRSSARQTEPLSGCGILTR